MRRYIRKRCVRNSKTLYRRKLATLFLSEVGRIRSFLLIDFTPLNKGKMFQLKEKQIGSLFHHAHSFIFHSFIQHGRQQGQFNPSLHEAYVLVAAMGNIQIQKQDQ